MLFVYAFYNKHLNRTRLEQTCVEEVACCFFSANRELECNQAKGLETKAHFYLKVNPNHREATV